MVLECHMLAMTNKLIGGFMMPLFLAENEKNYRIMHVSAALDRKKHLASLGVVEGHEFHVLSQEASGTIVRIGDTRLALDRQIASRISVEERTE